VAIVLLCLIAIVSILAHYLIIELPINSFMSLAWPQWISIVIGLLLLSWLLDDDSDRS
jgi:hypothetical protein